MRHHTSRAVACASIAGCIFAGCSGSPVPHQFQRQAGVHVATLDASYALETVPLTGGGAYVVTASGLWYIRDTVAQRVRSADPADSLSPTFGADFEIIPTVDGRAYANSDNGHGMWLLDGAIATRVREKAAGLSATREQASPSVSLLFAEYATVSTRLRDCEKAEDARSQPEDYSDDQ